jgi:hypothetical protein
MIYRSKIVGETLRVRSNSIAGYTTGTPIRHRIIAEPTTGQSIAKVIGDKARDSTTVAIGRRKGRPQMISRQMVIGAIAHIRTKGKDTGRFRMAPI